MQGRPLKYKTAEELEAAVNQYFEKQMETLLPPTVAGLALWLGFDDRRSIYDYKERPAFSHTIKKAILKIEQYAEQQILTEGSHSGAIFWLKNHGWKDKTETIVTQDFSLFEKEIEKKAKKYETNKRNKKKAKK